MHKNIRWESTYIVMIVMKTSHSMIVVVVIGMIGMVLLHGCEMKVKAKVYELI